MRQNPWELLHKKMSKSNLPKFYRKEIKSKKQTFQESKRLQFELRPKLGSVRSLDVRRLGPNLK